MDIARSIVAAKAQNAVSVLRTFQPNEVWPEKEKHQLVWIETQALKIDTAEHRAALMGIEGSIAKAYFALFARCNKSGMPWLGRVKFPAIDPLNALLSFYYSLLTQEMGSLIESEGLDPCLGFLHAIDRSRPSLALDLVEPFRHPVVDRLVLTLANRGEISSEDFMHSEAGQSKLLTPAALKRALASYEKWMLAAGGSYPQESGKA